MADNIENHYHQRPRRSGSSASGWIIGIIIALIAIAALWYYGTRTPNLVTTNSTGNSVITQAPAPLAPTPDAPAPAVSGGSTTTAPAAAPATP